MMAEQCPRERRMADPEALDRILQHWHPPVAVGRNGLRLTLKGKAITYGQFDHTLARFKGTKRKLHASYDPEDIRTVRVYDESRRYLCTVEMNRLGGARDKISLADVGELLREQRRYKSAKREVNEGWKHEVFNKPEILRQQARTNAPPEERPMQIIPTPMDGKGEQVRDAEQLKAAGAEGQRVVSLPDLQRIAYGGAYVNSLNHQSGSDAPIDTGGDESEEDMLDILFRVANPEQHPADADEMDAIDFEDLIDDATDGEPDGEASHAQ